VYQYKKLLLRKIWAKRSGVIKTSLKRRLNQ
jgi:hypothetical protein